MDRTAHILIVDDDREIRDLLSRFLVKHGLRVSTAADGRQMNDVLRSGAIDLIVLDLMLPGEDGLTLTRNLRASGATHGGAVPIIMLTAMGEETDRIIGLEMGADDYLAKPFNPRELVARIKAVLRRFESLPAVHAGEGHQDRTYAFADWVLNVSTHALFNPQGESIIISGGEFEFLHAFATHPGRVLNRDQLLDMARGRDAQPFDRAVDVQISRLRKKIEPDPKNPTLIKTVRGGGYMFTPTVVVSGPADWVAE